MWNKDDIDILEAREKQAWIKSGAGCKSLMQNFCSKIVLMQKILTKFKKNHIWSQLCLMLCIIMS